MNAKGFRIIAIEAKERKADAKNGQGLLGEVHMVQPESSPDEENRVLLNATGKPSETRQDNKFVEKLDVNGETEAENLPDLVPATESDEIVYFPEDDNLGNLSDSLSGANWQPPLEPSSMEETSYPIPKKGDQLIENEVLYKLQKKWIIINKIILF